MALRDRLRDALKPLRQRWDAQRLRVELRIDEMLDVTFAGKVPIEATISQTVPVRLTEGVDSVVEFDSVVEVPIDEEITVPLDLVLTVPLDTKVKINDTLQITTELDLDTTVMAAGFAPIPIRATVPVVLAVPIRQAVRIEGEIEVPVRQEITVRLQRTLKVPLKARMPVRVQLDEDLPVRMDVTLESTVTIAQTLPVRLNQTIVLSDDNVRLMGGGGSTTRSTR